MDLSNMKNSLFGYNKLAVSNYVSSLESESNQKIQDIQKESQEAQGALRSQLDELRAKYDEEVGRLNEKIDELTKERDMLRRDNDTIADTLLDAKEYAQDLRDKADQRDRERDDEHIQVLGNQQAKVQDIDFKIRNVLESINTLLETAAKELTGEAEDLSQVGQEIDEEKAGYVTAPEADAQEAESADLEAPEEAALEEAADETSDEAIEKAAGLAAEDAEEEEAPGSAVEEWRKVFGQENSSDESVSKFEQAAGEIAEKAAMKND